MFYLALAGAIFLGWLVVVVFFTPAIPYQGRTRLGLDHPGFLTSLRATCQAPFHERTLVDVFANGERFYPAMLDAIASATRSIVLECYIFQPGRVADAFQDALMERARAGVIVNVVVDAIGSWNLSRAAVRRLLEAGVRVERYQPLTWYRWHKVNNRTHREILVIDGSVAFLGGAGVADWWRHAVGGKLRWRDTMVRIEGPIVGAIQGVAAENWLECTGEILVGDAFYPALSEVGNTFAFVVKSSPSDRATSSRVVFQLLIENANRNVRLATPYFLPDKALRRVLRAATARGVEVQVLVPGRCADQKMVRYAGRRLYSDLLPAGLRIFEYRPSMMHGKMLIVDDEWAVVGTTNLDNRSFEHNDEINLAMCDRAVAARLADDFERDLAESDEITVERWRERPLWEHAFDRVVWILERQQ